MNAVSRRLRHIETLTLVYRVSALAGICGLALTIIFFFAVYTGQVQSASAFVSAVNVEGMWRLFKVSGVATSACGLTALVSHITGQRATKALERYCESHCSECGYELASIIAERLQKRIDDRKTGAALHGSIYFDVYCPKCKSQRTIRE